LLNFPIEYIFLLWYNIQYKLYIIGRPSTKYSLYKIIH